jgi:HEAT repeat protein
MFESPLQLQRTAIVVVCLLTAMTQPCLAQEAPGQGIFALQTVLSDKSPEIRVKAAQGLARVGGRRVILILRRGLKDKTPEVRTAVVEALGYVGGRLALTVLSEALKDRSLEVRIRAVESLRLAGTVSAVPIIQKAFGDKEASVRLHAALMIKKIGHRSGGQSSDERFWPIATHLSERHARSTWEQWASRTAGPWGISPRS